MSEYKTFVIRLQVKRGSQEEQLLNFLNDESARPFSKPQMILLALKAFWLTLSLIHNKHPIEQLVASLNQGAYLWQLQEHYLRKSIGVEESTSIAHVQDCQPHQQSSTPAVETVDVVEQITFQPFGDIVSIK